MRDEKVLVTGAAGQIAFPLCEHLAHDNEVWGLDLFTQPGSRARVESVGVKACPVDLGSGSFDDLPDDFTYVLHLAAHLATDLDCDAALRVNAEGTGLLLQHCRRARAALVMSTVAVYAPRADPWHVFREDDMLGDSRLPYVPTYSVSKLGGESVARASARMFDLPVVIARMNTAYGPNGGTPAYHLDTIVEGGDVVAAWDPLPSCPIYQDDINHQAEALLGAAAVPATIVNWGGDEAVPMQEWCAYLGELVGRSPRIVVAPGEKHGNVVDVTRRRSFTGPCRTGWRAGMRQMVEARYPEGPDGPRHAVGSAAHAQQAYEQRS
jgi:nucleoside-diphosphate-sugar epimerase